MRFAKRTARLAGNPAAFALAVGVVLAWALSGPLFGYSDTWQLTINTGTTIVTFLMVFLIQNSQNRDADATQVKLDELIRAVEGAHNALLDLEELDDAALDRLRAGYAQLAARARRAADGAGGHQPHRGRGGRWSLRAGATRGRAARVSQGVSPSSALLRATP